MLPHVWIKIYLILYKKIIQQLCTVYKLWEFFISLFLILTY